MPTPNLIKATVNLPQVLAGSYLSPSVENFYQVPAGSSAAIATATVCNTSGTARTVTVSVVKSGQSPTAGNRVAIIDLAPLESLIVEELVGLLLGTGDAVAAGASAASSVSMVLSGAVSS